MLQKLLNIEQFNLKKINKIKTKYFSKIGASSWYCWKVVHKWDFLDVSFKKIPKLIEILKFE
jgi:hypothetical protein